MTEQEARVEEIFGTIPAEFISVIGNQAACWMEVFPGVRVRVGVPVEQFYDFLQAPLELSPGDEFMWDIYNACGVAQPQPESDSTELKRLCKSLDDLKKEFHSTSFTSRNLGNSIFESLALSSTLWR